MWPPADGKPYLPSNGTEFDGFYSRWCALCANDDPDDCGCIIIANSMAGEQQAEWTWRNRAPHCAAFVGLDGAKPKPEPRCELTLEMFP